MSKEAERQIPHNEAGIVAKLHHAYGRVSGDPSDFLPNSVYHYTSAAGLYGILESGTLRASNFAYLNDASEIRYGESVVQDVLREFLASANGDDKTVLGVASRTLAQEGRQIEFYLVCFCTEPDLLSQWRGYGTGSGRFCIGFRCKELYYETASLRHDVSRVLYDYDQQAAKVREVIVLALEAVAEMGQLNTQQREACSKGICGELFLKLVREMCFFKHPGFAEEKEWRAVHWLEDLTQVQFEPRDGAIRPYIQLFSGVDDPKKLPIQKVLVGSSHLVQQSKKSVELLLASRGYEDVEVSDSGIPFREL
jgi:hypothetical protein